MAPTRKMLCRRTEKIQSASLKDNKSGGNNSKLDALLTGFLSMCIKCSCNWAMSKIQVKVFWVADAVKCCNGIPTATLCSVTTQKTST
jgi:hypothetical protein